MANSLVSAYVKRVPVNDRPVTVLIDCRIVARMMDIRISGHDISTLGPGKDYMRRHDKAESNHEYHEFSQLFHGKIPKGFS